MPTCDDRLNGAIARLEWAVWQMQEIPSLLDITKLKRSTSCSRTNETSHSVTFLEHDNCSPSTRNEKLDGPNRCSEIPQLLTAHALRVRVHWAKATVVMSGERQSDPLDCELTISSGDNTL